MKDNEYQCSMCGGIFEKGWSDEEARVEELDVFGCNDKNADIVCDDCYNIIMGIAKEGN